MTTNQAAQHAWKEYHKGVAPEVMPSMSKSFLFAFKAGVRHEKEIVQGCVKDMMRKYRNDSASD